MYTGKFVNVHKLEHLSNRLRNAYREYKDNFKKLESNELKKIKHQDKAENANFVAKINEYNKMFIKNCQSMEKNNGVLIDNDYDVAYNKWIRRYMDYCSESGSYVRDIPDFAYQTVEERINPILSRITEQNDNYIQPMLELKELLFEMLKLVVDGEEEQAKQLVEEMREIVKTMPNQLDSEDLILRTLAEDKFDSIYFYNYVSSQNNSDEQA